MLSSSEVLRARANALRFLRFSRSCAANRCWRASARLLAGVFGGCPASRSDFVGAICCVSLLANARMCWGAGRARLVAGAGPLRYGSLIFCVPRQLMAGRVEGVKTAGMMVAGRNARLAVWQSLWQVPPLN